MPGQSLPKGSSLRAKKAVWGNRSAETYIAIAKSASLCGLS
jgi:hypothetical protein